MEKQAEHAPWLGTTGICAWPKPVFPTHDFLNFNALAFAILWGYKTFDFNFVYPKHRLVDPALRAILGIHRELSRRVGSVALFLMCFLNFFSGPDLTVSTAMDGRLWILRKLVIRSVRSPEQRKIKSIAHQDHTNEKRGAITPVPCPHFDTINCIIPRHLCNDRRLFAVSTPPY